MFQKIAKHRANDASLTMHRTPLPTDLILAQFDLDCRLLCYDMSKSVNPSHCSGGNRKSVKYGLKSVTGITKYLSIEAQPKNRHFVICLGIEHF